MQMLNYKRKKRVLRKIIKKYSYKECHILKIIQCGHKITDKYIQEEKDNE